MHLRLRRGDCPFFFLLRFVPPLSLLALARRPLPLLFSLSVHPAGSREEAMSFWILPFPDRRSGWRDLAAFFFPSRSSLPLLCIEERVFPTRLFPLLVRFGLPVSVAKCSELLLFSQR